MEPVLLAVLEITRLAEPVLRVAEIEEPAVREEAGGIRTFVDGRTADFLQRETREHPRFRQHVAGVLVGHGHHDAGRAPSGRALRIGNTARPVGHVDKHAVRIGRIVPEENSCD